MDRFCRWLGAWHGPRGACGARRCDRCRQPAGRRGRCYRHRRKGHAGARRAGFRQAGAVHHRRRAPPLAGLAPDADRFGGLESGRRPATQRAASARDRGGALARSARAVRLVAGSIRGGPSHQPRPTSHLPPRGAAARIDRRHRQQLHASRIGAPCPGDSGFGRDLGGRGTGRRSGGALRSAHGRWAPGGQTSDRPSAPR